MRSARQKTNEKGKRIMRVAKRLLEARGALVETAPNVLQWVWDKKKGKRVPLTMRHDFFTVWDAVCVEMFRKPARYGSKRHVYFVQVTDVGNMAHRRTKILESGFPCSADDLILGQRPRTRKFRILRGPDFSGPADEWTAPKEEKRDESTPAPEQRHATA